MIVQAKAAPQAPIERLPNELLAQIFGFCAPDDFAQITRVNRHFYHNASYPDVQRPPCARALCESLAYLHAHKQTSRSPPYSKEMARQAVRHATHLVQIPPPDPQAPKSWLHLVQQAQHAHRCAQSADRATSWRRVFQADIWPSFFSFWAVSLSVGLIVFNEGAEHGCRELMALGATVVLACLAVLCLSPVLWLAYNLLGVVCEDLAKLRGDRIKGLLRKACYHVDLLLQPLA